MKERIEEILSYYQLTSSAFADKLGVQRSGISHILSGRNKPSYDFLVSLTDEFPDINTTWLLTGKGAMFNEESDVSGSDKSEETSNLSKLSKESSDSYKIEPELFKDESKAGSINSYKSKQSLFSSDDIEAIVVFYKDGSYKSYVSD